MCASNSNSANNNHKHTIPKKERKKKQRQRQHADTIQNQTKSTQSNTAVWVFRHNHHHSSNIISKRSAAQLLHTMGSTGTTTLDETLKLQNPNNTQPRVLVPLPAIRCPNDKAAGWLFNTTGVLCNLLRLIVLACWL